MRALGDKTRMQILAELRGGERCGNELLAAVEVSQSTLSHHMKTLTESGLVTVRRAGKWSYYAVAAEGKALSAAALEQAMGGAMAGAEPEKPAEKKKPVNKFETWL